VFGRVKKKNGSVFRIFPLTLLTQQDASEQPEISINAVERELNDFSVRGRGSWVGWK
jgi:hypothetical protein